MKAYGLPRVKDLESPDSSDIFGYALKSSIGHIKKKGGDTKNSVRSSSVKKSIRRIQKKKARANSKINVLDY